MVIIIYQICPQFSGTPTLVASNFWAGESDPAAHRVRPRPRKMGFPPNKSPTRLLKRGGCVTFSESRRQGQKNVGSWILNFGPQPEKNEPKGWAGRPGNKNFGIWTFFIKGTPAYLGQGSIRVLCLRVIGCTPGAPGVRPKGGGQNLKVKIGTCS